MSEGTRNNLDNSEFNTANTSKDISPASVSKSEEDRLFDYMKMLKMRAEIEKDKNDLKISMKVKTWQTDKWVEEDKSVGILDLLPVDSEFEKTRKLIIISLNKAGPESESFRKYASRFGSNSIFELSSRITNYVLDEKRRRDTYSDLLGDPLKHA
jgi:hypothetical protein